QPVRGIAPRMPRRPQTINSHLHLLSEILARAVREGLLARNPAEGEDVRLEVRRGKEGVAGSSPAEGFIGTPCSWRVSGFRALIGFRPYSGPGVLRGVRPARRRPREAPRADALAAVQPSACRAPGPPTRRRRDA